MGWSARKSLAFGPLRVNLSRSGIGLSAGVRGARVSVGPRGTYVSFGAGGFRYQHKLGDSRHQQAPAHTAHGAPAPSPTGQIATASAATLAQIAPDAALEEVRKRITRTNLFKVYAWSAVIFLLWLVTSPFLLFWLAVVALTGIFVYRWDRERRTARIFYDVDNDEIVGRLALCDAVGESLASARSLWRIHSSNRTDQSKYHAGANTLIERHPTRCAPGSIKGLDLNIEAWAISVGSQEFLLLPDRLLVREGKQLAAVPYERLSAAHRSTSFVEDGPVPPDAKNIGTTWRFVNKSGGPDLRFNNNRQLPVLEYGELALQSGSGLNTLFQASTPAATWHAANALQEIARITSSPAGYAQQAHQPVAVPPSGTIPMPAAPSPEPPRSREPVAPFVPSPPVPTAPTRSSRRFVGPNEAISIAGRNIARPLTFVAATTAGADASTIVTSLPVGDARHAGPLPYWPSYSESDPDQRARYLDWMAGGRTDPNIELGYVFIFFYGLEWRALRDAADVVICCGEVRRLLAIHGRRSASFRGYASEFLVFAGLARLESADEEELDRSLGTLFQDSSSAVAAVLAWYHRRGRPLPDRYAMRVAASMDDAKRGVVVKRAEQELAHLFAARYREAAGDGILLVPAKKELTLEYRPGSATWQRTGAKITFALPDILRRPSQFVPLVRIWNQCVDDLRKATRLKEKHDGALSAEAWAALPEELREQYDHPHQERWDAFVAAAPKLGGFRLVSAGDLAALGGVAKTEKISAAQLRKVAETGAELGYAVEPDPRAQRKGARWRDELLVWQAQDSSCPDLKLYGPAFVLLSLAMQVAMADGTLMDEEAYIVISMLSNTFSLDESLRTRFVALQHLLTRQPVRAATLAKKLQSTRTRDDLLKVGRVLASVAAADGVITDKEHQTLRSLYKALGLSAADLAAAIAASGARLASDAAVEIRAASSAEAGEQLPKAPGKDRLVELDQNAIAAILADTRDVAAMLADVFDKEEEEDLPVPAGGEPMAQVTRDVVPAEVANLATGLDVRYHGVLAELISRPTWSGADVRALAKKRNLMPGAIVETINTWSDEVYGEFLIEDAEPWQIRADILRRQSA